jgi:hypothetical protein
MAAKLSRRSRRVRGVLPTDDRGVPTVDTSVRAM